MEKADKVILSSNIWTGNANQAIRGGVAIKGNKIIYVGFQDLADYTGPNTEVIDYKDKLVIPGLHDAHDHMLMSAVTNSGKMAMMFDAKSEAECVERLQEKATGDNLIGGWLMGMGWYQLLWDDQTLPTKASLDRALPDIPVIAIDANGHTAWVNSAGLEKLGISEDSPDPAGGTYQRDEDGHLTGLLFEAAQMMASSTVYNLSVDEAAKYLKAVIQRANSYGITQVDDMASGAIPHSDMIHDEGWKKLLGDGDLTVRVNMYPTLLKDFSRANKMVTDYGRSQNDSMLGIAGLKTFFDGVSSVHTAYLSNPYSDATTPDDRGKLTVNQQEMQELVDKAAHNHYSVRIHAIGDAAVTTALDIFEKTEQKYGEKALADVQYTIEHLENIEDVDIERLRDLDVIASCQPGHALIDPAGIDKDLGPVRTKMMWPFRQYLSRNVRLAFGTDSPVIDINPFENIYNAVTRKSIHGGNAWQAQNSITIPEALRAYTYGASGPAQRQQMIGTLEVGKLADIAVLDRNILEEDPKELLKTHALFTMVNGKVVYQED